MRKTSLAQQRQACEHLVALCRDDVEDTILNAAKDACRSMAWFEKRYELIRLLIDLESHEPELAAFVEAFPGSKLKRKDPEPSLKPDDNYDISRDA